MRHVIECAPGFLEVVASHFSYDPATGEIRWIADRPRKKLVGQLAGRVNRYGYRYIEIGGREIPAHRLAWRLHHGTWPPAVVDHINGVRDDNRIDNLRLATASQNAMNRGANDGRVLPKGVSAKRRAFVAEIAANGKRFYLGSFPTVGAAARAYQAAAKSLHGQFSRGS